MHMKGFLPYVGVFCGFIRQGRHADEAWLNRLIKSSKHLGPVPDHRQLFLRGREQQGGDMCCLICR